MTLVSDFVTQIIAKNPMYTELDRLYLVNRLYQLVGETPLDQPADTLLAQAAGLVAQAVANGKIEDSLTDRELLQAAIMDFVTPTPALVNQTFWNKYQVSPTAATDYFYQLSQDNDYIKTKAIAKNVVFPAATPYGDLEITINLSKPEKDPKAIAAAQHQTATTYPKCQLCMENEGYYGRLGYPARSNHRIIRLTLGGQTWGFQYSPYAYFTEHAIFLAQEHRPMAINQRTFTNLLNLVTTFPTYFVGSNADLPIVGGSMLTHDHYQGGHHTFPMMKAPVLQQVDLGIAGLTAGIVKWPLATLRLTSNEPEKLINAATKITDAWRGYSDDSLDIRAFTGDTPHHTVTPIAYRQGDAYVLDVVLRDNQTSEKYPDGIFHPHQDVQHIKKENIGLIEVMGRAILPARLKTEMHDVEAYLVDQPNQMAVYHKAWADDLKAKYQPTPDNVQSIVHREIGVVFARVLEDAGVYKQTDAGLAGFNRFIQTLTNK